MESKVLSLIAAAIAVTCPPVLAAWQSEAAPRAPVEQQVILRTPAGARVPSGVHRAEITAAGRRVAGVIVVAPQDKTGQDKGGLKTSAAAPAPPAFLEKWGPVVLAAAAPLLLIGLGALIYLKVIRPKKLMAPFREAMGMVARKQYDEALPKLTAIESKLVGAQRRQARFTVAFCYVATKGYGEAELTLAGLRRESPEDVQVACLLAWLKVLQKRYEEAEPLLDELAKGGHLDEWQVRRLSSITKLSLAHKAFGEGRISEAATLFEEVQTLGLFAEHVPADLRNQHVVLGLRALFEKDSTEAREQFREMETSAAKATGEQRTEILAKAKLGLALACWIEDTAESAAKAEELLADAVVALDSGALLEREWPKEIPGQSILEKLDGLDAAKSGPRLQETQQCLRDVHFLRAVVVLRRWKALDGKEAYAKMDEHYEQTLRRLACALAVDSEFRDVYLTAGLLMFYTQKAGAMRSEGIAFLKKARELGVRDPETMEILAAQDKRERMDADVAAQYMEVLDKYLSDETVRSAARTALMRKLSEFRRFPPLDRRPDLGGARGVEPTVEEIRRRSETLMARLADVLKARGGEQQKVSLATQALNEQSKVLAEQARVIEQSESELLLMAGEVLFADEVQKAGKS